MRTLGCSFSTALCTTAALLPLPYYLIQHVSTMDEFGATFCHEAHDRFTPILSLILHAHKYIDKPQLWRMRGHCRVALSVSEHDVRFFTMRLL